MTRWLLVRISGDETWQRGWIKEGAILASLNGDAKAGKPRKLIDALAAVLREHGADVVVRDAATVASSSR